MVLVTDDGRWSYNITIPTKQCEKVYGVGLSRSIADDVALKFEKRVKLQGEQQLTLPAILEAFSPKEVLLTITEGKLTKLSACFLLLVIVLYRYIAKKAGKYS